MDSYIVYMQTFLLAQLKIWHWQTNDHACHVALGELYEAAGDKVDGIVELWQGRTQTRITVVDCEHKCPVDFKNPEQAIDALQEAVELTASKVRELEKLESYGDVVNILEELNGILGSTMYLLTLK